MDVGRFLSWPHQMMLPLSEIRREATVKWMVVQLLLNREGHNSLPCYMLSWLHTHMLTLYPGLSSLSAAGGQSRGKIASPAFITYHILWHWCQTQGPWAKFGPPRHFVWPARAKEVWLSHYKWDKRIDNKIHFPWYVHLASQSMTLTAARCSQGPENQRTGW